MALLSTAISSAPASVFVAGKELDTKTNLNPRRLRPQPAWTIFTSKAAKSKAAKSKANVSLVSNRSNSKSAKNKIMAKIFKRKSARSKRKKIAKSAVAVVRILL